MHTSKKFSTKNAIFVPMEEEENEYDDVEDVVPVSADKEEIEVDSKNVARVKAIREHLRNADKANKAPAPLPENIISPYKFTIMTAMEKVRGECKDILIRVFYVSQIPALLHVF